MDIFIKVKPNSRVKSISREGANLVVRVAAPAHEGRANEALVDFLSAHWKIPKSKIAILSGHSSRFKRISIPDEYRSHLGEYLPG